MHSPNGRKDNGENYLKQASTEDAKYSGHSACDCGFKGGAYIGTPWNTLLTSQPKRVHWVNAYIQCRRQEQVCSSLGKESVQLAKYQSNL